MSVFLKIIHNRDWFRDDSRGGRCNIMKSILLVALLVFSTLISFQADVFAYDFSDDFSTDTIGTPATLPHEDYSGNYNVTNSFGSGGLFHTMPLGRERKY